LKPNDVPFQLSIIHCWTDH